MRTPIPRTALPRVLTAVSCLLLAATLLRQHPNRSIRLLPSAPGLRPFLDELVPDWRFFAPRPMTTDILLFVRTLDDEGNSSPWTAITEYPSRSLTQLLFFPSRRRSKAMLDVTNGFLVQMEASDSYLLSPAYHLLREFVRVSQEPFAPEVVGYQFCVVRDNGYEGGDIDIPFVSGFIPRAPERGEAEREGR